MPPDLQDAIRKELEVVDTTPHVALLYGAHPDIDFRPERIRIGMPGVHDRKIAKTRTARDTVKGSPELTAAYDAKIAKEEAGKAHVLSPKRMRGSVAEAVSIVADLDFRLADGREWICGDIFTLADVFWAVSLFRLKWIGAAFAWQGRHALNERERPSVAAYGTRLFDRPGFRAAAIDWPRMPQSEHVADHFLAARP